MSSIEILSNYVHEIRDTVVAKMSSLPSSNIIDFIRDNPNQFLTAISIGTASVVTYKMVKFYRRRRDYPSGSFPLPVVGNTFYFYSRLGEPFHKLTSELSAKYGAMYTMWIGSEPVVFVTDPTIGLEILKRHQFAGRPTMGVLADIFFEKGSIDIAFADFNSEFEVLRKVSHSAIRKYAVSPKLPEVTAKVVDDVVENMKSEIEKEGQNHPIDIKRYLTVTLSAVLSSAAFGRIYTMNDPELKKWIDSNERLLELSSTVFAISFMPILRHIPPFRSSWNELINVIKYQRDFEKSKYEEHVKSFDLNNEIRDFTDALLAAKQEAELELASDQSSNSVGQNVQNMSKYLHPANIINCINDLFTAGSDTSRTALWWGFLIFANDPTIQENLRNEIKEQIGGPDVIPTIDHRSKCHYTSAFLAEMLRFRHVAPFGLPHKATVDTEIGEYKVKKGTTFNISLEAALKDGKTWIDPDTFRPERFLDDKGYFTPKPNPLYVPFSAGRRTCPGEKLALVDMFLILTRFLQQTEVNSFELGKSPGLHDLEPDPKMPGGVIPKESKLWLVKKN